jgi:hypothetical protein
VFLSIVAKSVSDALAVAYPHARVKCLISSKHIRCASVHQSSIPPWICLSDLRRRGMEQVVPMVDIIDGQVADDIVITGYMSQATILKCIDVFPSNPTVCTVCIYSEAPMPDSGRLSDQLKRHLIECLGLDASLSVILNHTSDVMPHVRAFIFLMSPQCLVDPHCMSFLKQAYDVCQHGSGRKLYIIPTHPCTMTSGISTIIHNEGYFFLKSSSEMSLRSLCTESLLLLNRILRVLDDNFSICGRWTKTFAR